jgi:protein gp37
MSNALTIANRDHVPNKDPDQHAITWTGCTWNITHGCTKLSEGCQNCYACPMAHRQQCMGHKGYENGFAPTERPDRLDDPRHWRKARLVFVSSMGDFFHEKISDSHIKKAVAVMADTPQHIYQVLTKRPERLLDMDIAWPSNVWVGTTVENAAVMGRIGLLKQVRAAVRWLSIEPLIGPLPQFDHRGLDWLVVGGESGPGARPMDASWVRSIRDACLCSGTPFHFKQWGGRNKKAAGRLLDGRTWDEMPMAYGDWLKAVDCTMAIARVQELQESLT